jgi:hypothetical protein
VNSEVGNTAFIVRLPLMLEVDEGDGGWDQPMMNGSAGGAIGEADAVGAERSA